MADQTTDLWELVKRLGRAQQAEADARVLARMEVAALDVSWAALSARARTIVADLKQTEADAASLLLDLTRAQMGTEQ